MDDGCKLYFARAINAIFLKDMLNFALRFGLFNDHRIVLALPVILVPTYMPLLLLNVLY